MKTREQKQQEAQERQARYDLLSDREKLKRALKRGHVRTREVQRLEQRIREEAAPKAKRS